MTLLAAGKISNDVLRLFWLQRLPLSTQQILTSSSEDLPGLTKIADKILEVTETLSAVESVNTDSNDRISKLEARIEELTQTIRGFSFPSKILAVIQIEANLALFQIEVNPHLEKEKL
ncbi:hypothetical protein AVEN_273629-1 [Araneus ventricosus]|nr:hypothetical protein AVEN_273629-1 [Araneus ventricosus]